MDNYLNTDLEFMADLSEDELNEIAGSHGKYKDFAKGKDDDDRDDDRDDDKFEFDDDDFKFKMPKPFVPKKRPVRIKKPFGFKPPFICKFPFKHH
ncbi:MAG: hypothetical protein F6J90_23385 [Moorea sp. SIOASIH]|uniref:hypothetical protein n=1 Tax=Moorena sp. SIOASIH TaxID=2607817 RepID=UPI0013BAD099|nr:hypothetical protein [Moorena sp. SIOASIH]NEO39118.1 hypothetical protein [Moorena sp. SIOASIH]